MWSKFVNKDFHFFAKHCMIYSCWKYITLTGHVSQELFPTDKPFSWGFFSNNPFSSSFSFSNSFWHLFSNNLRNDTSFPSASATFICK
jgi:hypothetical protein